MRLVPSRPSALITMLLLAVAGGCDDDQVPSIGDAGTAGPARGAAPPSPECEGCLEPAPGGDTSDFGGGMDWLCNGVPTGAMLSLEEARAMGLDVDTRLAPFADPITAQVRFDDGAVIPMTATLTPTGRVSVMRWSARNRCELPACPTEPIVTPVVDVELRTDDGSLALTFRAPLNRRDVYGLHELQGDLPFAQLVAEAQQNGERSLSYECPEPCELRAQVSMQIVRGPAGVGDRLQLSLTLDRFTGYDEGFLAQYTTLRRLSAEPLDGCPALSPATGDADECTALATWPSPQPDPECQSSTHDDDAGTADPDDSDAGVDHTDAG